MSRLPNINEVVTHVLNTAGAAQTEKVAAEVPAVKEYKSDVAQSLKKLAQHLRSAPAGVTYEDVFEVGNRLLRNP
jgi:hypothetical protein